MQKKYKLPKPFGMPEWALHLLMVLVCAFTGTVCLAIAISFSGDMQEKNIVNIEGVIADICADKDVVIRLNDDPHAYKIHDQFYDTLDAEFLQEIGVGDAVRLSVIFTDDTHNYLLGIEKNGVIVLDQLHSMAHWRANIHTAGTIAVICALLIAVVGVNFLVCKKRNNREKLGNVVEYLDTFMPTQTVPSVLLRYIQNNEHKAFVVFWAVYLSAAWIGTLGFYSLLVPITVAVVLYIPYGYFVINNKNIIKKAAKKYSSVLTSAVEPEEPPTFYRLDGFGVMQQYVFQTHSLHTQYVWDDSEDEEACLDKIIPYEDLRLTALVHYRKTGELVSIYVLEEDYEMCVDGEYELKPNVFALKLNARLYQTIKTKKIDVKNLDEILACLESNMLQLCTS